MDCPLCESSHTTLIPGDSGDIACQPTDPYWECLDCFHTWGDQGPDELGLYKASIEYCEGV